MYLFYSKEAEIVVGDVTYASALQNIIIMMKEPIKTRK